MFIDKEFVFANTYTKFYLYKICISKINYI